MHPPFLKGTVTVITKPTHNIPDPNTPLPKMTQPSGAMTWTFEASYALRRHPCHSVYAFEHTATQKCADKHTKHTHIRTGSQLALQTLASITSCET